MATSTVKKYRVRLEAALPRRLTRCNGLTEITAQWRKWLKYQFQEQSRLFVSSDSVLLCTS